MPNVQIKDVPERIHATLRERAAKSGKSLQEYLLERLTAEAEQPTLAELFVRVDQHNDGIASLADASLAVRADRDTR